MDVVDYLNIFFTMLAVIAIAILIFMYTPKGKRWLKDL